MRTNELRIGNWYLSTKFQVPVICEMGDMYEIYMRAEGSTVYTVDDIFQPIPLTEVWLEKFGFKIFPWGWVHGTLKDKAVLIRHLLTKHKYWVELGNGLRIDLPYVHTLQNFFALTGEELTI